MTYYYCYSLLKKITHESLLVLTCRFYLRHVRHDMVFCPRASAFYALNFRSI